MRIILLMGIMLACKSLYADEAFVLIDVVVLGSDARQPKWIALKGKRKFIHVPVGESIIAVKPGKYRLGHFDFQKNKRSGLGTVHVGTDGKSSKFVATPNAITYFGIIELKQSRWGSSGKKYKLGLNKSKKIFEWACDKKPELFSRYPVSVPQVDGSIKKLRIRCDT